MTEPALCQCAGCFKYLTSNRTENDNYCEQCHPEGIPLADIRGTLTNPAHLEMLGLLIEEMGEVMQRVGKIIRWGWYANFDNTTQQHKLEVELADVRMATLLMVKNGLVSGTNIVALAKKKIKKLWEDRRGPRQRILHAELPEDK